MVLNLGHNEGEANNLTVCRPWEPVISGQWPIAGPGGP